METLQIYGQSDDLIETSGIDGCDEFNKYASDTWPYVGKMLVSDNKQSIIIHIIYDGSWAFAITANDDDDKLPDWAIRHIWGKHIPYSQTLEIDVPDNAKLEFIK